jgi:hypothetical protein
MTNSVQLRQGFIISDEKAISDFLNKNEQVVSVLNELPEVVKKNIWRQS